MELILFFILWAITAASLGGTVAMLWWIYEQKDTYFGVESFKKEAIIVLVVSFLLALAHMFIPSGAGRASGRAIWAVTTLLVAGAYKLTHLEEMEWMELGLVVIINMILSNILVMAIYVFLTDE